jgi:asparagine synthase (glutamine-hydrolysing)
VHGFTIMNSDSRYEEKDNVEAAVKEFKIRHTAIPLNTDHFLANLRKLVVHHDSPVYTISLYAHWLLIEAIARHRYRISISGTAADELFTGYYDHHLLYLQEVRQDPELHAVALNSWSQHIGPMTRNPHLKDPDVFVKNPQFRGHLYLDEDLFRGFLKEDFNEPFEEETYSPRLLRNRMLNEMFHESVPPILHEDDHNAMYYSVENRSPFLDRALFDFSNSIPTRYLIQNGYTKALLRDAMRGLVPNQILDSRRKVGFNAPIFSFLDVHDPAVRKDLLNDSPIFDIVRRDKVEALIRKPDLPNSESLFLFYFLNSKIFLEEFAS